METIQQHPSTGLASSHSPTSSASLHPEAGSAVSHPKAGSTSSYSGLFKSLAFLLLKIGVIVAIAVSLFSFVFGLFYNVDPSMTPAIKDGDLVMFYRLDKDYKAGDSTVIEIGGEKQVRRVVATAGNVVDITDKGLMINGAFQQESAIYAKTRRYDTKVQFPLTVQEGQIFVLGDSREIATDSRVYGVLNSNDTLGKVMALLRRRDI
jgi:signal peptidase I